MRVFRVERDERAVWAGPIAALEAGARYPLGEDRFRLDHGRDYFAFFDRLGDVAYYVAAEDGEVLAVGCGMLRRLPGVGAAWYIGDLKVRPEHRGRHIPLRMFAAAFVAESPRCRQGYGISMDPPGGENRVLRLFRRFPVAPIRHAATLRIWSLDVEEARAALPLLRAHRGEPGWRSLAGVKDLVMESTGRPLPLLHAEYGGAPADPVPGAVHMVCAPDGDALADELRALGLAPSASATVIALGMDGYDWRRVKTSEI